MAHVRFVLTLDCFVYLKQESDEAVYMDLHLYLDRQKCHLKFNMLNSLITGCISDHQESCADIAKNKRRTCEQKDVWTVVKTVPSPNGEMFLSGKK